MSVALSILDELELGYLNVTDSVDVGAVTFSLGIDPNAPAPPSASDDVTDWFIQRRLHDDPLAAGMMPVDAEGSPVPRDTSWVAAALPRAESDREYNDRGFRLLADGEPLADEALSPEVRAAIVDGFFEIAARRALTLIPMLDTESVEMGTFRVQSDLAQTRPGGRLEQLITTTLLERYGAQIEEMPQMQTPPPADADPAAPNWDTPEGLATIMESMERTPKQEARVQRAASGEIGAKDIAEMVLQQVLASQNGVVPLGLACRVVQVGADGPDKRPEEVFGVGLSIDYRNPEHIAFRDAVQALFPAHVHVLNSPPPARVDLTPGGVAAAAMKGRPAVDLDL
jgi:hypothetical protein